MIKPSAKNKFQIKPFLGSSKKDPFNLKNGADINPNESKINPESGIKKFDYDESSNPLPISEATPGSICTNNLEDNFMLDSLNDQHIIVQKTTITNKTKDIANKNELNNDKKLKESNFMNVLETAINHFEKDNSTEDKKEGIYFKRSPSFSYNNSNITTTNSTGEKHDETSVEYESLKIQYKFLLNKYNNLQTNNKQLMNNYAVLRSQFQEVKAVSLIRL